MTEERWRLGYDLLKLIGSELISDKVTAVVELVKNSYDANATKVLIRYEVVDGVTSISIEDDGIGMTVEDIRERWLVIGLSKKKEIRKSPMPFQRVMVGSKGIGRFAMDKLAERTTLVTKHESSSIGHKVEVNWDSIHSGMLGSYLADVPVFIEDTNYIRISGTTLRLTNLRDTWQDSEWKALSSELALLIDPVLDSVKFEIRYEGMGEVVPDVETSAALKKATLHYEVGSNSLGAEVKQQMLYFDTSIGDLTYKLIEVQSFGPIGYDLYYFNKYTKGEYRKLSGRSVDGIRVYRNGVLSTPFIRDTSSQSESIDPLGLEARRYSDFFDKISNRDIIMKIYITDHNDKIEETTNRQSFIENSEFSAFRQYILAQIQALEDKIKFDKEKQDAIVTESIVFSADSISSLRISLQEMAISAPAEIKPALRALAKQSRSVEKSVSTAVKQLERVVKERDAQQELFYSLLSLQAYSAELAHLVRTSTGVMRRSVEYIHKYLPDSSLAVERPRIVTIVDELYLEMTRLISATEFMLSYTKADLEFETIVLRDLLVHVKETYSSVLLDTKVDFSILVPESIVIRYNYKFIEDIFTNLLSNAIKAFRSSEAPKFEKKIVVYGELKKDLIHIDFSDNATGISADMLPFIFNAFKTSTPRDGGAGMGLYTVKKRVEAMNGSVSAHNNTSSIGATFTLELPIKATHRA